MRQYRNAVVLLMLFFCFSLPGADDTAFLSSLSEDEIAILALQEPLSVLIDPSWEPLEYRTKEGEIKGLSVAYLHEISTLTGLEFVPVQTDSWQESYDKLLSGEIAMTSSISKTVEREATLRFSDPYLSVPLAIIAGEDVGYIGSLAELDGKSIAVVSNYAAQEWLKRDYPHLELLEVATVEEGLSLVSKGACFAMVENLLVANHYRSKMHLSNTVKVVGTTAYMNTLSIALHKDYEMLLPIINKALIAIDAASRESLYRKYLPLEYERTVTRTTIYLVLGLTLLIIGSLIFWIWILIREIHKRKQVEAALEESEGKFRQLFSGAPAPMAQLALDGTVIASNDAWAETFGFAPGTISDIDAWYENVYPDPVYREEVRSIWDAAVEETKRNHGIHIESHEFSLVTAKQEALEMEVCGTLLEHFILVTFFDVTDRNRALREMKELQNQGEQARRLILNTLEDQKQAQQSLAQSKATLDAAINSMIDAVFIIDTESRFILINDAFLRYYRFSQRSECPVDLASYAAIFTAYDANGQKMDQQQWAGFKALEGNTGTTEYTVLKKPTNEQWIGSYSYAPIRDGNGNLTGAVVVCRDVTEMRATQKKLVYQRNHDYLTGLYSRVYFETKLQSLEKRGEITLAVVDINGLKLINDSFGHSVGDGMLKATAQILRQCCGKETLIARYGGDEFVFLLSGNAKDKTESILSCLEEHAKGIAIEKLHLSISAGYAVKEVGKETLQETLKRAEDQLQRNKIYESSSTKNKAIALVINSLFAKSPRELLHSRRVSALSEFLARQLQLSESEVKRIRIAGLLHDIGKIGISEAILNKPTRLDDEEWELVKRHPEIGYRILSASAEYSDLSLGVLEHHEMWNGEGYPRGLKGEAISLQARIISVADSYDAMTSERSYKKPLSQEVAIKEIQRCSGTMYDPLVVKAFVNGISQFEMHEEMSDESDVFL